jgi:DNA-binding Xre family transcriptional regulator
VKYDGKFASRWRAKSLDALCAVLPCGLGNLSRN